MSEKARLDVYEKKLEGICEENGLVYRFRYDHYPVTLTIRPCADAGTQLSMLEDAEENGYISPDAYLVFTYLPDGQVDHHFYGNFSIGDRLLSKLKNLFKNMHFFWMHHFFREVMTKDLLRGGMLQAITPGSGEAEGFPDDAEPPAEYEDAELPELDEVSA